MPSQSQPEPILTVVESIPGQHLNLNDDEIYNPEFWMPYFPFKISNLQKIDEKTLSFHIDDQIQLDPTGMLKTSYKASGTLEFELIEISEQKGGKWEIKINIPDPKAIVHASVRARNLPNALKIGMFLYKLELDEQAMKGYGKGAVMFAIRFYLRNMLQKFEL